MLYTGTYCDNFIEKLKGYTDRNIDNEKYVMCVVIYMEYPMKMFEEDNMQKYLDEEEARSILKKKRLELALTRYIYREEKIKENTNKIYGMVFG